MMSLQTILLIQAVYYLPTALWAMIHIRSFEKVTGPKSDRWLVYTVASLLVSSSLVFLYSGARSEPVPAETIILAVSNCLSLISIDVIFVFKKKISKVYVLDAVGEIAILVFLMLAIS
ncbi:MAG: hypothetical protein WC635_11665 [Bacteriovorax sp.]